jgi:hypothetical protein
VQLKSNVHVLEGHAFDTGFQKVAITHCEGSDGTVKRLGEIHAAISPNIDI